jgi:hypothetical protein
MAVTIATRRNLLSGGMLHRSIHPFARHQAPSHARRVPFEAASLISFPTIGFPDMLGKPYNDTRVPNYVSF